MFLTITLILLPLVAINFLLLIFSSNKTNTKKEVTKRPPMIIREREVYTLSREPKLAAINN